MIEKEDLDRLTFDRIISVLLWSFMSRSPFPTYLELTLAFAGVTDFASIAGTSSVLLLLKVVISSVIVKMYDSYHSSFKTLQKCL